VYRGLRSAHARAQVRLALFPEDRPVPAHARAYGVQVRLRDFTIRRSRQWGACWLFLQVWEELPLPRFWQPRLPASREGTSWYHVLVVLCAYRLIAPGSEWRLHRQWFEQSAMADLLGEDFALAAKDTLYRALDRLCEHKEELFHFLQERWKDLFGLTFDVLLYDLTSTYFESDPPFPENDPRRHGYSRDHRPDCVQVVIALVVTPEGFPLAYEVLAGNTADHTTLRAFLKKIEQRYGQARRIWVMDRGIPAEAVLAEMRQSDPPVSYVVGTPKGRLSQLEAALIERPWHAARARVQVKLLPQGGELYVLVQSGARVDKERAMRRRKLKKLWRRLRQLQKQRPGYERLLLELGAAKKEAGRVWSLVRVDWPEPPPARVKSRRVHFTFALKKEALRQVRRREGRYLLRSNLTETDPARLWEFYLQLVEIEAAFKNLKGDLVLRPIYHQRADRIEAHVLVSFLAYCVHVSLARKTAATRAGADPAQCPGEVCGPGAARRALPDDRRARVDFCALHAPGGRAGAAARSVGTEAARAKPAADHRQKRSRDVGQTFGPVPLENKDLPLRPPASSESQGSRFAPRQHCFRNWLLRCPFGNGPHTDGG